MNQMEQLKTFLSEREAASNEVYEGADEHDPVRAQEDAITDTIDLIRKEIARIEATDDPDTVPHIEIEINGGVAELMSTLPPGITLEIRDYDVSECDTENEEDANGVRCWKSSYGGGKV